MFRLITAGIAFTLLLATAASADELPAACLKDASMGAMSMDSMDTAAPGGSDAAHTALMAGMDEMNRNMMAGAAATDIDVAFVCSMLPHHLGAIAMAKAELAHGDDPWARQLATNIIAAQEKEIAEMKDWLARQK